MRKGFTLIELLAVIVIIGILAVITVPIIQNNIGASKTETKGILEQRIIKAAEDWSLENINSLPTADEETKEVLLETLQTNGHLPTDLTNPETGKKLSSTNSYVTITKTNNGFSYTVTLVDE